MILSREQEKVYELWKQRENIFISGPGGCGKTALIQYIYHRHSFEKKINVCAMTGCAAVLLDCQAVTIHSWSGIRYGNDDPSIILSRIKKSYPLKKRWKEIECLIIDEISMMSIKILELLDYIAKNIRRNQKPFGGIQVLFSGDFYQLPPIEDTNSFCFESPLWKELFKKENQIELKTIFRQSDIKFKEILNGVRKGILSKEHEKILKQYLIRKPMENIIPTKLYPMRFKCDTMNNELYNTIDKKEYSFSLLKRRNEVKYIDSNIDIPDSKQRECFSLSDREIEKVMNDLISLYQIPKELNLKEGTIIMTTSNIDIENGICNGSQGIITDINNNFIKVKFFNGVEKMVEKKIYQSEEYPTITVSQFPLCYAWAMTIHKIQGTTLDCAEIDIGRHVFTYGQSYVALSRLKSLDGLYLKQFSKENIQVHPKVSSFYNEINVL